MRRSVRASLTQMLMCDSCLPLAGIQWRWHIRSDHGSAHDGKSLRIFGGRRTCPRTQRVKQLAARRLSIFPVTGLQRVERHGRQPRDELRRTTELPAGDGERHILDRAQEPLSSRPFWRWRSLQISAASGWCGSLTMFLLDAMRWRGSGRDERGNARRKASDTAHLGIRSHP